MKRLYFYLGILLTMFSCNIHEPISVKENVSNQIVLIEPGIKNHITKDSIPITIPVEFNIQQNTSNIIHLDLYFVSINGKRLLKYGIDYETYDKQNPTKPHYFSLDKEELESQRNNSIIVAIKTQMISIKDADLILKKYNIDAKIGNLELGDFIKLVGYDRFRKDNPDLIEDFRKVNDSVVFSVSLKGGERAHISQKINW
ncbi:hypothetical protein [Flavobacterium johnsoniae]|nr:hypothetical protein [Flavobacterium johnsoniae]OXE98290.1 hypothetical protein B0A63_15190 [Flavobacterium johnsoniae UW101]WQG81984.1 hypothetical protein SR927_02525 [Flavobacterium johnsoniae UW101]SHK69678.1 hypothetical protein SAMN05444146_1961 [Flavobacterium johnsoniae]